MTSFTATSITNMAKIIGDAKEKGYMVISGRPIGGTSSYAFYSIKRDDLFDKINDCYFQAYINDYGTVIYNPYDEKSFFNGDQNA